MDKDRTGDDVSHFELVDFVDSYHMTICAAMKKCLTPCGIEPTDLPCLLRYAKHNYHYAIASTITFPFNDI